MKTYRSILVVLLLVATSLLPISKNEDKLFDMVRDLAALSAKNRNLVLPEDEAAGRQAGEYIKQQAKLDHGQLLYAVVDQAVRRVGKPATSQTSSAAPQR